jgi:inorganic pyrophosphatase
LAEDGDPVDVLVPTPMPIINGAVIRCRPVGMLRMTDDGGPDSKILALPIDKVCVDYQKVQSLDDLPETLLNRIAHFFEHYKDLEKNKWVKLEEWEDEKSACKEIMECVERYNNLADKPHF